MTPRQVEVCREVVAELDRIAQTIAHGCAGCTCACCRRAIRTLRARFVRTMKLAPVETKS